MPVSRLLPFARSLRREQTKAEARLWGCLRSRGLGGFKWKRQAPLGAYVLDFVCPEIGLVVEVGGGQHSEGAEKDAIRTAALERSGLKVIRFWNYEVLEDLDAACATILAACEARKP